MRGILLFLSLLFVTQLVVAEEPNTKSHYILYLMQTGNLSGALKLYREYQTERQGHDLELIEQMGLILLDQGYRTKKPEVQLLTLFGAAISMNEKAMYILQEGLSNPTPQLQMVALNFLARYQNDNADILLNRAMASDYLLIRLEAAFHLATKKAPQAVSMTESLMHKVPQQLLPLFPQLFALIGNADAMKIMGKLLTNSNEQVRVETINSAALHQRDDLLANIRILATHHEVAQQEACAHALGVMKDEGSAPKLEVLSRSSNPAVRLAALQALYQLGRTEIKVEIEKEAQNEDLFAINLLGQIPGSENALVLLANSQKPNVKLNAVLALLEKQDPRCVNLFLRVLYDILVKDTRDLGYRKVLSKGKSLSAWKVTPSSRENFKDNEISFELSLNMRESVLKKALDLPEKEFLIVASLIFEIEQNDLVPTLVELLGNLQTPGAVALLKKYQQKAGAPLIRNYCNLALYELKEPGPYANNLIEWVKNKQNEDFIRFRTFIPWEMRDNYESYQLTPQETSQLLIQSFEAFVRTQDDKGIDLLLDAIEKGNENNKYALAGLLMRAAQ